MDRMTADPLWYKDAVFYQVNIRAFADGNGDGHGDFVGLTKRLDYFRELGVDCIWLMPMYPSPLRDDGYDISDFTNIRPEYGTLEDFKTFMGEAHGRGLRVVADLVMNHTSDRHPWFQSARAARESAFRDYYVWSDTDQKYLGARIIFVDFEKSNWTWDPTAEQYFWHRFYSHQPDLNYNNPAVRGDMFDVARFWLDLGLDGFRADAVPYLFEREGTNCENLPETHAFLKQLRKYLDENYPGRILLAEANQWPQDVRPYFGDGDEFQMAFHFPVMPRIYMSLAQADSKLVENILRATPPIPDNCQWCTFLRNHDELTLEMVTPEEREFMWRTYAPVPRMKLNLGIRRRLAPLMEGDRRKIELLFSLLFSLPGSPIIYYGDEIGMGDNIWLDDRNGVRTPMQWDATPNGGFSEAAAAKLYSPVIQDEPFGLMRVNVAAQRADPGSLWHTVRRMIGVRQEHRAFGRGEYEILQTGNRAVLALSRAHGDEFIVAVYNLSAEPQQFHLNLERRKGAQVEVLLAPVDRSLPDIGDQHYSITLSPYEYLWLKLGSP